MSAYIVEKQHILFLVSAAMNNRFNKRGFSWCWTDETKPNGHDRGELRLSDYAAAAAIANTLWLENIRSVSHRYPGESSGTLPGPGDGEYVITTNTICRADFPSIDPVQVLKSCDCYEYQSCEHPGWESSEAHAFINSLRSAAVHALPGYDDAAWGAPEKKRRALAA